MRRDERQRCEMKRDESCGRTLERNRKYRCHLKKQVFLQPPSHLLVWSLVVSIEQQCFPHEALRVLFRSFKTVLKNHVGVRIMLKLFTDLTSPEVLLLGFRSIPTNHVYFTLLPVIFLSVLLVLRCFPSLQESICSSSCCEHERICTSISTYC